MEPPLLQPPLSLYLCLQTRYPSRPRFAWLILCAPAKNISTHILLAWSPTLSALIYCTLPCRGNIQGFPSFPSRQRWIISSTRCTLLTAEMSRLSLPRSKWFEMMQRDISGTMIWQVVRRQLAQCLSVLAHSVYIWQHGGVNGCGCECGTGVLMKWSLLILLDEMRLKTLRPWQTQSQIHREAFPCSRSSLFLSSIKVKLSQSSPFEEINCFLWHISLWFYSVNCVKDMTLWVHKAIS